MAAASLLRLREIGAAHPLGSSSRLHGSVGQAASSGARTSRCNPCTAAAASQLRADVFSRRADTLRLSPHLDLAPPADGSGSDRRVLEIFFKTCDHHDRSRKHRVEPCCCPHASSNPALRAIVDVPPPPFPAKKTVVCHRRRRAQLLGVGGGGGPLPARGERRRVHRCLRRRGAAGAKGKKARRFQSKKEGVLFDLRRSA
eukprot:6213065-Pleurochrysis_carterae.AAC.2